MALQFSMWSLVVKKSALDERYPGGWKAFADKYLGREQRGFHDSELVRLGAMAPTFDDELEDLERYGILAHLPERPGDAVLGDAGDEHFYRVPWLSFGTFEMDRGEVDEFTGLLLDPSRRRATVVALRLTGGSDDQLAIPFWTTNTLVPGSMWTPMNPVADALREDEPPGEE